MARRATLVSGFLGALALTLSACTGGATVPDGWQAVDLDGLSFAHPDDLTATEVEDGTWTYRAVEGAADDPSLELRATGRLGADATASEGTSRLLVNFRLAVPDLRVVATDGFEAPGASSAERVVFTYEADDGRRVDGVWFVLADLDDPRSAVVQVTGYDLDADLLDDLEATIELTEAPAPADEAVEG
jgi:hypothetical protein